MNAHTLAVWTSKGGTGKTTTAHSLGCCLSEGGARVLMIDIDPQANLSFWCGIEGRPTLYSVLQGELTFPSTVAAVEGVQGLDLIPSDEFLIGAEPLLRAKIGAELWLRKQIERLPARWDWIIIDCPPGLGILSIAALGAADWILAPVEPVVLGLAGVAQTLQRVEEARENLNDSVKVLGILPVKVDSRLALTAEVLRELREQLGERLLETLIRTNVRLAEAPSHRRSIFDYAPGSRGAEDYRALTAEVLRRVEAR